MYFISNEVDPVEKSNIEPKLEIPSELEIVPKQKLTMIAEDNKKPEPNAISNENINAGKRVYGRARANLSFSSFYIFCEDFRKQLDYLYAHESESYRKNMLNYMWKHLNVRDKHKYYETATKARTMYNLPEHPHSSENDKKKPTITSTISYKSNGDSTDVYTNSANGCSKVVGKLVKVKFSKSCTTPIITPLREASIQLQQ